MQRAHGSISLINTRSTYSFIRLIVRVCVFIFLLLLLLNKFVCVPYIPSAVAYTLYTQKHKHKLRNMKYIIYFISRMNVQILYSCFTRPFALPSDYFSLTDSNKAPVSYHLVSYALTSKQKE